MNGSGSGRAQIGHGSPAVAAVGELRGEVEPVSRGQRGARVGGDELRLSERLGGGGRGGELDTVLGLRALLLAAGEFECRARG